MILCNLHFSIKTDVPQIYTRRLKKELQQATNQKIFFIVINHPSTSSRVTFDKLWMTTDYVSNAFPSFFNRCHTLQQARRFRINPLDRNDRPRVTELNNGRFAQFDIGLINASLHPVQHIIADEFANGRGKVKINGVNIFCNKTIR